MRLVITEECTKKLNCSKLCCPKLNTVDFLTPQSEDLETIGLIYNSWSVSELDSHLNTAREPPNLQLVNNGA